MKLEEVVGANIAQAREDRQMSQAELGEALGRYLDKPWARQAVSAAEKGRRAFAVSELVALALALEVDLHDLLTPPPSQAAERVIELPGTVVDLQQYVPLIEPADTDEFLRQMDVRTIQTLAPALKNHARTAQLLYATLRDLYLDPSVREADEAEAREADTLMGAHLRELQATRELLVEMQRRQGAEAPEGNSADEDTDG